MAEAAELAMTKLVIVETKNLNGRIEETVSVVARDCGIARSSRRRSPTEYKPRNTTYPRLSSPPGDRSRTQSVFPVHSKRQFDHHVPGRSVWRSIDPVQRHRPCVRKNDKICQIREHVPGG